jgi:hypothetical protein
MPEPTPERPTIPDFRDRSKYPTRPSHHKQSYHDDFNLLIEGLARDERQHQVEAPPKPLCDPAMSQAEYERKYAELRRKLSRY